MRFASQKPNMYLNLSATLSGQPKVRLNKINGIKDYFVAEIKKES